MNKMIVFLLLFTLLFSHYAFTAETIRNTSTAENSVQSIANKDIQSLQSAVNQSEILAETDKSKLTIQLKQVESWINSSGQALLKLQQHKSDITNLSRREIEVKSLLKKLESELQTTQNLTQSSSAMSSFPTILNNFQTDLDKANQNYLNWDAALNQFQVLASDGADQKLTTEKALEKLTSSQQKVVSTSQQDLTFQVENLSQKSRIQLLNSKLQLLQFQLDNLGVLSKHAQLERDFWLSNKTLLLKILNHIQGIIQIQKAQQAQSELEQTVNTLIDANSPLYPIQAKLIQIQQDKTSLTRQENTIQQKINATIDTNNMLQADYARDKQIIELEGSRDIVAQVLHKRVDTLSTIRIQKSTVLSIKDQLNQAVLAQILLSENLRQATQKSPDMLVNELLSQTPQTTELNRQELENSILEIQSRYIEAAKELQNLYPGFISKLSELNSVYIQQQQQLQEYTQFLHNHLLWLPNVQAQSLLSISALRASLDWFFAPQNYNTLFTDINETISTQQASIALWSLVIILLVFYRSRFKHSLEQSSAKIASIRTDSILYTLKAFGFTFLLTILMPFVFVGAASLFNDLQTPSEYTQRLTNSLMNAGILTFILGGLQQICRPGGLAEKHLHWSLTTVKSLYKELKWAVPFGALLIIIIGLNTDSVGPSDRQLIGRLGFIVLMAGLMILIYRLWSPKSDIMRMVNNQTNQRSWAQLHFIWFPLLLLIPAFLIWSTLSGYYYSSLVIAERLNLTAGLLLIIYMFRELLLRSLYLSERKLDFSERVKQQEILAAARQNTDDNSPKQSSELPNIAEPEVNYDKLNNQVRQTVNLGYFLSLVIATWFLWSDIFLALNLINDSTLPLLKSQVVDGVIQQVPLTLGDLIQGLTIGAVTLLVAKNLPGILEFTLLKYLPISNAARYAVSSLTQYIVAIIGFILIFRALGIEWSNIQWLVAALSVGLGFGLQEIVANFVSGIILLFEQPLRVGDIVTVDGVTGKVSKIRIRATTIVNWDRQELVIPNKQIITGQLINWSLSDPINRVKIDVGIAYGSDVRLAMNLILEAAQENSKVLTDPEPTVIFDSFGDNSLGLALRGFSDDLENLIIIKSELRNAINDKLNEAGIVVSFPQRDVHLDTSSPLEIYLTKAQAGKKE
ncbi:MAG: mechanosensitive ion channel [Pseudomonadota bacterium]|nr:mechanosensitive ion channel [Pseudomonadota bacterium]